MCIPYTTADRINMISDPLQPVYTEKITKNRKLKMEYIFLGNCLNRLTTHIQSLNRITTIFYPIKGEVGVPLKEKKKKSKETLPFFVFPLPQSFATIL
jgi:hypothetical protein